MNSTIVSQQKSKNQAPAPSKGGQGSGSKGAWHTFTVSPLELEHCFTCPLHDCVGVKSLSCPINQARARQAAQPIHLQLQLEAV